MMNTTGYVSTVRSRKPWLGWRAWRGWRGFGTGPMETGAVLILMALIMTCLLGIAGFAVDLGSWYVRSSVIQRTADAAALAGAAYLPDQQAEAKREATDIATANGFTASANLDIALSFPEPKKMKVTITDKNVPTYFSSVFGLDKISISRQAIAQNAPPIPLGSPLNVFGTGDFPLGPNVLPDLADGSSVQKLSTWATMAGWCTAAEQGDDVDTRYAADGWQVAYSATPLCDPTVGVDNPGYDAARHEVEYEIVVPPGAPTQSLFVYDAPFVNKYLNHAPNVPWTNGIPNPSPSDDTASSRDGKAQVTTHFDLYVESTPHDSQTATMLPAANSCTKTYTTIGTGDPVPDQRTITVPDSAVVDPATGNHLPRSDRWSKVCGSLAAPAAASLSPTVYLLRVQNTENELESFGTNDFSLVVQPDWGAGPGTIAACNSTLSPLCPSVSAKNVLPVFVNDSSTQASPFLAKIDGTYAGQELTVTLWDPGEGMGSVALLDPQGHPVKLDSVTVYNVYTGLSEPLAYPPPSPFTSINVSGCRTIADAHSVSYSTYNDRELVIKTRLPANYKTSGFGTFGGQDTWWWRLQYDADTSPNLCIVDSSGVAQTGTTPVTGVHDATTWRVSVDGDPLRLVNK